MRETDQQREEDRQANRERENERERDRQTDRQTEKQTARHCAKRPCDVHTITAFHGNGASRVFVCHVSTNSGFKYAICLLLGAGYLA